VPVFDERTPHGFCRERLARPLDNAKYRQPAGTSPHVYFPVGVASLIQSHAYVIITEGEFKALSLVEAGYPAIAIAGIYNFRKEGVLLPEFVEFFDWSAGEQPEPITLYFLGDADTSLNPEFSKAAVRLLECLRQYGFDAIRMPRMDPSDMERRKGIDDARQDMDESEFLIYMETLLSESVMLRPELESSDLAMILFERDRDQIANLIDAVPLERKPWYRKWMARLADAVGPATEQIIAFSIEHGLVETAKELREEMKIQKAKQAREMEAKRYREPCGIIYHPLGAKNYLYPTRNGYTRVDRTGALNQLVTCGHSKSLRNQEHFPKRKSC